MNVINELLVNVGTSRLSTHIFPINTEMGRTMAIIASLAVSILTGVALYYLISFKMACLSASLIAIVNVIIGGPKQISDNMSQGRQDDSLRSISSENLSQRNTMTSPNKKETSSPVEEAFVEDISVASYDQLLEETNPNSIQVGLQLMMTMPPEDVLSVFNQTMEYIQQMPPDARIELGQRLRERLTPLPPVPGQGAGELRFQFQ